MPRKNPALTAIARTYRKPSKRQYAEDFADHLDGFRADEPPRPSDLSYLAARSVRLAMYEAIGAR